MILIAEDSAVNRKILVRLLSPEYDTLEAENGQEALDLLHTRRTMISGVILDLVMPVMDGFSFLKAVGRDEACRNLPIVVATGNDSEEMEVQALELGAWDFITKPYNGEIIRFRLRNAIARSQLSAFERLKYLAEFDTLTGIYNQTKFLKETRKMLDANPQGQFALVRLDIDRFQLINSFFGTEEGDRLLIHLARNMSCKELGAMYTYGRIEGDVFAMCFPYPTRDAVIQGLVLAREKVKAYNRSFDIVPIFGVYFLDDLTISVNKMLDRATLAAKTCKGNYMETTGVYTPELSAKLEQEQEIINEMVTALEEHQFCVYLQPQYALETNSPTGAEALVRWRHPTKGLIPPGRFIPVFEKNGFISKLDYYMWDQVCALLQTWLKQGHHPAPISVNVSRVNLYNPHTVEIIDGLVREYALPPRLLQLELTESAYMDNPKMMEQFVCQMHERGFTILMDDFGSGYSSLSVLKNIDVDVLKIDMRFFETAKDSNRGANIIASVVRMAKWLNIPTVAEGVEKAEQVSFLRSVGCDFAQGYYFARPMPVESYQELLVESGTVVLEQPVAPPGGFDMARLWCSDPEMEVLFSNATQANCVYEFDGERVGTLRVNRAFRKLFGYSKESTAPETLSFAVPDDRKDVLEAFQNCVDAKTAESCIYRSKNEAGRVLWVDLKLQYICQVGDQHILMGQLTDVTAQKLLELELDRFRQASLERTEAGKKILIVDDSDTGDVSLRQIFRKDYQVLFAPSGEKGLALMEQHKGDLALILLDMQTAQMDETEFLLRKSEHADTGGIPVLAVLPDDDAQRQTHMLRLGVNDYITKPFVPEVVERRVRNVLEYSGRFAAMVREYRKAVMGMPNEKLFEMDGVYTAAEMRGMMVFLKPVFDTVRLVDPTDTCVISLEQDGSMRREPYSCFHVWNKDTRCENCTSMCAVREECRMTKYEFIQNNVFYVTSNPLTVEDLTGRRHRLVLEIVSRVSDHLMLGKYGEKTVSQLIAETQEKIYKDELTGAYNRRFLREMLFTHHGQTGLVRQMALVMLDLHGFKQINDQHGHAIGDDVLARVAKALMKTVRQSDSVIRYGGDEFLVILTNCTEQQTKETVGRIRHAIGAVRYGEKNRKAVSAELGYAYTKRFDFKKETLEEMLHVADEAMYQEKKNETVDRES